MQTEITHLRDLSIEGEMIDLLDSIEASGVFLSTKENHAELTFVSREVFCLFHIANILLLTFVFVFLK